MFRRFPYTGWLLSAAILWSFVFYRHYLHTLRAQPAYMAQMVSNDLFQRSEALQKLLKKNDLFVKMFKGNLSTDEVEELANQPFYIYAFEDDTDLIFWNSNIIIGTCNSNTFDKEDNTLFKGDGMYLKRCLHLPFLKPNQTVVVLFPITVNYPFQNDYLQSSFIASGYIPLSTKISADSLANSQPVNDGQHHTLFYLQFNTKDTPRWVPDAWMVSGLFAALLATIIYINLIAIALARRKGFRAGLALIVSCITISLSLIYGMGLPLHLSEITLFSPQLYAANNILSSLGILLIDVLFVLWVTVFTIYNNKATFTPGKKSIAYIFSGIALLLLLLLVLLPATIIKTLVIDSRISFDVTNFYAINAYSIIGLIIIALIFCTVALAVYLLNNFIRLYITNALVKYALLLLMLIVLYLMAGELEPYKWYSFIWLQVFIILQDISLLTRKKNESLFAPRMVLWLAFIAISATFSLEYFNVLREKEQRRSFAENSVRQRDDMMEYVFADIGDSIQHDSAIVYFFTYPDEELRLDLNERLSSKYLKGQLARYQAEVYLYDRNGKPMFNKDTTRVGYFMDIMNNALPTYYSYLFYRERAKDGHYYIADIPVSNKDSIDIGRIIIDFSLKNSVAESVYPELLQPEHIRETQNKNGYSYAIYSDRELIYQTSDYPFPIYLNRDTLQTGAWEVIHNDDYPIINYKTDAHTIVSVVDTHKHVLEIITLFSYMLGMLMVLILATFLIQLFFRYTLRSYNYKKAFQLTLRKRILFAILGVVMISFLIIGAVTIWIFVDRYDESGKAKLRASMQSVERSIQQYLKEEHIAPDPFSFHAEADEPQFKSFIIKLANSQSIDINVYNSYGSLKATSQEDIYNKQLLARIMMPDAYYKLSDRGSTLLVEKEQVGTLRYLSCYVPLKNQEGEILGYINVPFFSSQKELNYQISNILVALINLYAFIFLLSSIVAVLISNLLTKGLQIIIERLQKFNLKKNEPIQWPYDDEIGMLIREYNSMVKKVEENAALLAQNERETAWREMARQVAHEIKNPLTPMKLNIQYLQKALKSDHPDVKQLTNKVSDSLIEQIDNLSHIASAFSDFAKMPEAAPEHTSLNELLQKATQLYTNNSSVQVTLDNSIQPLIVFADRSQLLRVFTNLLQNAVESIPEDRKGKIQVSVVQQDKHALISIADNGNGIPSDIHEKIFNPYFTTKGSGTGLGLAMTKKIIEFWKGKIWFDTEEHKGTTFFVKLPLENS